MQLIVGKKSASLKKSEILYITIEGFLKGYCYTSILYSNPLA
jgi:hypothetical protein